MQERNSKLILIAYKKFVLTAPGNTPNGKCMCMSQLMKKVTILRAYTHVHARTTHNVEVFFYFQRLNRTYLPTVMWKFPATLLTYRWPWILHASGDCNELSSLFKQNQHKEYFRIFVNRSNSSIDFLFPGIKIKHYLLPLLIFSWSYIGDGRREIN